MEESNKEFHGNEWERLFDTIITQQHLTTSQGMCQECSKIAVEVLKKSIPFLYSQNELMSDEITTLKNVTSRQKTFINKYKQE